MEGRCATPNSWRAAWFERYRRVMADDNIQSALEELKKVAAFKAKFGGAVSSDHAFGETIEPIVRAVRYLAAEIEALRDDEI